MRIIKKHIIIAGVPRAGKSTVSKRIVKNYGYQHISMDSVIAGIEKTFPETGVDTNASDRLPEDNLRYISSKMGPFIRAMMNSGEYDIILNFDLYPETEHCLTTFGYYVHNYNGKTNISWNDIAE